MFSHEDIWRGIDRLANSFGYSPSGLAKQAGLDPTSFNKSKRCSADGKPRWPSTESLAKILAVTGATMSDLTALIDSDSDRKSNSTTSTMPKYIPLLGFAQAGNDGFFNEDGYPSGASWDEIQFPERSTTSEQDAYALEVNGDSMMPLYRDGDLLIVSPTATIRRGDRIVVKTAGGEVLAKKLKRQTASKIELLSLNIEYEDRAFPAHEIIWMARILWISQ